MEYIFIHNTLRRSAQCAIPFNEYIAFQNFNITVILFSFLFMLHYWRTTEESQWTSSSTFICWSCVGKRKCTEILTYTTDLPLYAVTTLNEVPSSMTLKRFYTNCRIRQIKYPLLKYFTSAKLWNTYRGVDYLYTLKVGIHTPWHGSVTANTLLCPSSPNSHRSRSSQITIVT